MQTVKFEFNERPYCLCFNGAALFAVQEKYGDGFNAGAILAGTGTDGFSSLCWLLAELAEQGELVRRYLGYDPQDIPTPEYFEASLGPLDTLRAKKAVLDALALPARLKISAASTSTSLSIKKKRDWIEPLTVSQHADTSARTIRP